MGYEISTIKNLRGIFNWYLFLVGNYDVHGPINDFFKNDFSVIGQYIGEDSIIIRGYDNRLESELRYCIKAALNHSYHMETSKGETLLAIINNLGLRRPGLLLMNKNPKDIAWGISTKDTVIFIPFVTIEEAYTSANTLLADISDFVLGRNDNFLRKTSSFGSNSLTSIPEPIHRNPFSSFDSRLSRYYGDFDSVELNAFPKQKRFKVAFSFPGEHREYIKDIVLGLVYFFPPEDILYDGLYCGEFSRPDLDAHLQTLFESESELIVVLLCQEYSEKTWCRKEWEAICSLRNKADASRIMYIKRGDCNISGFNPDKDGYIDAFQHSPHEIAYLIRDEYNKLYHSIY